MAVKSPQRPVLEVSTVGYRRRRGRRRRWLWSAGALGVLVLAALAAAFFAWPRGRLAPDTVALARVLAPSFGSSGVGVTARLSAGTPIPLALRGDGRVWPLRRPGPGARIEVVATFRRPGWAEWLVGRTQRVRLTLVAPAAHVEDRWPRVRRGAPLRVRFDRPVRVVETTGPGGVRRLRLARPARTVVLGRLGAAGSVEIRAAVRSWERLSRPTTVTWFPPGRTPGLLVSPAPGRLPDPDARLRLRFSEPVKPLLRGLLPSLRPHVSGRWRTLDTHTIEFVPHGYGLGLESHLRLTLPVPVERIGGAARATRALSWTTPSGTELRLQQLLAELGYLPVEWTPASDDAPRTVRGQIEAALHAPAGSFDWRYPNTPPELRALWSPGQPNTIVRGAIMMFQDVHGLTVDGFAGADIWRALIADAIAGRRRDSGYSYVYVHRSVPQSLNLWHNGDLVLSSPGNTGVPAAPTQLGTFPVFEHIPVGTMSGTNPDGSHYNDPGIRYISYFNGGDAIHAFNRASFGTPQSLGCVELPLAAAAQVWPYTPIGTLVTVED